MGTTEKQRASNRKYQDKFYRPTVYCDKELSERIKAYCSENEISVNEFFNQAADLLLSSAEN